MSLSSVCGANDLLGGFPCLHHYQATILHLLAPALCPTACLAQLHPWQAAAIHDAALTRSMHRPPHHHYCMPMPGLELHAPAHGAYFAVTHDVSRLGLFPPCSGNCTDHILMLITSTANQLATVMTHYADLCILSDSSMMHTPRSHICPSQPAAS